MRNVTPLLLAVATLQGCSTTKTVFYADFEADDDPLTLSDSDTPIVVDATGGEYAWGAIASHALYFDNAGVGGFIYADAYPDGGPVSGGLVHVNATVGTTTSKAPLRIQFLSPGGVMIAELWVRDDSAELEGATPSGPIFSSGPKHVRFTLDAAASTVSAHVTAGTQSKSFSAVGIASSTVGRVRFRLDGVPPEVGSFPARYLVDDIHVRVE